MIQLSSGDEDGVIVVGDYDGDGWDDLAVEEEALAETIRVYGGIGQRLANWELRMQPKYALAGDMDGDGKDEFVCKEGSRLAVYGVGEDRWQVDTWPLGELPAACHDLNGDGTAEVIGLVCEMQSPDGLRPGSEVQAEVNNFMEDVVSGPDTSILISEEEYEELDEEEQAEYDAMIEEEARLEARRYLRRMAPYTVPHGGILDVTTGQFTPLQVPEDATAWPYNMFSAEDGEIRCADINGDGDVEIIAKSGIGSALLMFNTSGELIYHEEFGKAATQMDIVHTSGGPVLVVLVEDRLLAYP